MKTFVILYYFGSESGSAKAKVPAPTGSGSAKLLKALHIPSPFRADIQRQGFILAWIVILSVYSGGTIAKVKLLISPFLC